MNRREPTREDQAIEEGIPSAELRPSIARLRVLAEVSDAFAAAVTSYDLLLEKIARTTADLVGDGCQVLLIAEDGENLVNVASAHREPSLEAYHRAYLAGMGISTTSTSVSAKVVRTGEPTLVAEIEPAALVAQTDDALKPLVARLNVHSFAVVPIRARQTIIGTLTLMRCEAGRGYTFDDLMLLQDMADRAGLAIANARLYDELERRVRQRTAALEAANEALGQLAAIVECSDDAILSKTPEGIIRTWNRGAERLYGYAANEMIGRSVSVLAPPERSDEIPRLLERVRRGEPVEPFDTVRQRKDGSRVEVSLMLSPVLDGHGRVTGVSTIARDITLQRRLEQQVVLAGRMASLGTLAAGVAHEINNPLAYVTANLDTVLQELRDIMGGSPSDRLRDLAEVLAEARDGAERIRRIVRGLKTFSTAEEERRIPLELRPVLEASVNLAFNELKHRARLVKDYGSLPIVSGDESRLAQVFINLLVNAAHSLPEGRVDQNEIRVTTRTDATGRAVVEVRDSGSGIPEAIRGRIFDPFFTTKPVGTGTGLGLSICHSIVAAHGGQLTFDTELGRGTTFRVVLPAAAPDDRPVPQEPIRSAAAAGRRGKILIVDDEPLIAKALSRVLAAQHDVAISENGRQALDRIQRGERFDAILCDVMMPELTGMDLYAELKTVAPEQVERIIFVTGGAFTSAGKAFLDAVPNARIEKPFDPANIRSLVRGLVR
jgi:PAS domain S-box-containing protein